MFKNLTIFRMAEALALHSNARQVEVARNVANSDTPGFRAGDISKFSDLYGPGAGLELKQSRAGHRLEPSVGAWKRQDAPDGMSPNGNTVSLETQMLKAADIRHAHDMALGVYASSLSILRSSLGGRG